MLGYGIAGLLVGLLAGLAIGWWRMKAGIKAAQQQSEQRLADAERRLEQVRQDGERQLAAAAESAVQARGLIMEERDRLRQERDDSQADYRSLGEAKERLGRDLERQQTEQRLLEQRMEEKQRELTETQERLRRDFENLANRIFEEKNRSFQEQSRKEMNEVINPLKERIVEFQTTVHNARIHQTEQSSQLKEQITQLTGLNNVMLQDARNLTNALKGDSKTQGNWGELILETVLDKSGLEKGREYVVQASGTNDEGRRLQPDVVLNLPGNKTIVLDSKVSLTAFERYSSSDDPEEQQRLAKAHLDSVRSHVRQLSEKDYPSLYGFRSLDFVLMFVPVEPAFSLALRQDDTLYMEAFNKGVVLVTPSTLLATLRTIKHIWKQENQSRNVMLIAEEAGKLHDNFVRLLEELKKLGAHLDRSQATYQDALKRLSDGPGNLVRRVDKLRLLGAKAKKEIPQDLRQEAVPDEMPDEETDVLIQEEE